MNFIDRNFEYIAGTGKTRTLVATIQEIVRSTSKYVLVCAQSNSACDEITLRLLPLLKDNEILRIYATSYKKESLDKKIAPISNLTKDGFQFPSLKYIYQFRVIICTICTAGCISRARNDNDFDSKHFGFVIIDEAGCVPEITSLIPIAGVCTDPGQVHSKIILSGDPKQLDAVAKSKFAIQLGYKTSFLEFLFNQRCFKRNSNGHYSPNRVVQLLKNYRSHAAIIHVPNELFYGGVLEAAASSGSLNLHMSQKYVPFETAI